MSERKKLKRPSLLWGITEGGRAAFELASFFPYKKLNKIKKDGDMHPVLVLPGFLASDFSTVLLRNFIENLGYSVYGWKQGRNLARLDYIEALDNLLEEIHQFHREEVSIIGWSLGGIYARQLAKANPDMVRQVITLASPFKGVTEANNAKWIYDLLTNGKGEAALDKELMADIPKPAPVPSTAIYTKEDGVVPWEACLEDAGEMYQNIQVRGSHLGLGVNLAVLKIIADRLKFSEVNWRPYVPKDRTEELFIIPTD